MSTFFDTIKKSFVDVPVDEAAGGKIPTTEFLEASESLLTLFGAYPAPFQSFPWAIPKKHG